MAKPDGEELLASMRQEQGRPSKDQDGLHVKPIFGHSGVEQGVALLQMICETLRIPFRRCGGSLCLNEWWAVNQSQPWKTSVK